MAGKVTKSVPAYPSTHARIKEMATDLHITMAELLDFAGVVK